MMPNDEEMCMLVTRAKVELRKRLRALRNTTPASACAKRSERIVERLVAMDVVRDAKSIALFWPIEERHEVDLRPLDEALRARGTLDIAYPGIDVELGGDMTFRVAKTTDLADGALGFRGAPATLREASSLDVVVVPSIALDARGMRLGYGAGFYDRALARFPSAIKVGVAYDFQLLAEVPSLANDVPMDWVVTDARVINCGETSSP